MTKLQTARAACSSITASRGMHVALIRIACNVETPEAEALFDEIMRQQAARPKEPGELTFADIVRDPNPPIVWTVNRTGVFPMPWKKYRRTNVAEMRAWAPGDDMTGVSVAEVDVAAGSPKRGDMIARNPTNHDDQWLVAAQYFANNFEPNE